MNLRAHGNTLTAADFFQAEVWAPTGRRTA